MAGLQVLATAKRLGGRTTGYAVGSEVADQVRSVGAQWLDLGIDAAGEGGYARAHRRRTRAAAGARVRHQGLRRGHHDRAAARGHRYRGQVRDFGANDVTNPAARKDSGSPIHGMPILNVDQSKSVIVLERSMSSGYAGIDNPLFTADQTSMLFGDQKKMVPEVAEELEAL